MSQRTGIVTVLNEKGKDPDFIENYKPISLSNLDYKLYTKLLATRLKNILPKNINQEQCGFAKWDLLDKTFDSYAT